MPDMLVKLYELPPLHPEIEAQNKAGVTVRRVIAPEKHVVLKWVRGQFNSLWESETEVAFMRQPASCFIATEENRLLGFACYDATARGFFGPTGVDPSARGRSIGKVLLLACLHDMWNQGYGYAIIGGVGPADFYAKIANATLIEGSQGSVYKGMLRDEA